MVLTHISIDMILTEICIFLVNYPFKISEDTHALAFCATFPDFAFKTFNQVCF